ncbi:type III secretion system needle filament subunit SctF [Salmonella enterica]|nr:type III secretion system needle filament subunit SctF [Salmonella enterica]
MNNIILNQRNDDPSVDDTCYLATKSQEFDQNVVSLMDGLKKAEEALEKDPSNPAVLARYQARLQDYTLFRNAQTNTIKVYKDIGAAIIQNFR